MAEEPAKQSIHAPDTVFGALTLNWGWMLALGILFIVLGTIGLGMTFALTLASVIFFGALLLAGGVMQLLDAFKCKAWKGVAGHVLIALLYLVAGGIMVYDPLASSAIITMLIAATLIAIGVLRLVMAVQTRGKSGWGWLAFAGLVSLALGGMILIQWPASGLWIIGLFVAIELIFHGWAYLFVALAARRAAKEGGQSGPSSAAA